MKKYRQQWVSAFMVLMLSLSAGLFSVPAVSGEDLRSGSYEENVSGAAMGLDLLVVRPICIVATAVGAGLFVVSLPFSAAGGNVKEVGETLVTEPAKYTFTRPLGHFD